MLTVNDRYGDEEIERHYDTGQWSRDTLTETLARRASLAPDKVFVFDSTRSYTYSQMHEAAIRVAAGLKRSGIRAGDRVAVQLPNFAEFAAACFAINRAGGVIVPIMPIYRGNEVEYILQQSGAKAVITVGTFNKFDYVAMYRQLSEANDAVGRIWAVRGEDLEGVDPFSSLEVEGDLDDLQAELGPDRGPDEPLLIVYTSGTTSRPKGCVHTFNTAHATAVAMAEALDYSERDVQFGPSPVTHSTGMITSIILPLIRGASSHFMEAWEPSAGMQRIIDHRITCAVTATPFLQMLLGVFDKDKHDVSSMRVWVCAGSPIPGSVVEASNRMFSNGTVLSLYGRSENYTTTMVSLTDPTAKSITSDGRALPHAAVKVVDDDGSEVPQGEEGDIAYKGPSHMLGYHDNEAETTALFTPDGFSRSGDLGRMDADGFVRVTGRSKDIIIRGGMNISAREVEDLLLQAEGVQNVAAVAMPDERLGEKVCAFVIPQQGAELTLDVLTTFLRDHGVATQKLPERLEILDEFPMTATGKVQKHVLRALIADKLKSEEPQ